MRVDDHSLSAVSQLIIVQVCTEDEACSLQLLFGLIQRMPRTMFVHSISNELFFFFRSSGFLKKVIKGP